MMPFVIRKKGIKGIIDRLLVLSIQENKVLVKDIKDNMKIISINEIIKDYNFSRLKMVNII